jgi:hypothetical protein
MWSTVLPYFVILPFAAKTCTESPIQTVNRLIQWRRCLSLSETTERPSQADSKPFMLEGHTVMYVRYVSKKYLIE